jgi:hypothetical protein
MYREGIPKLEIFLLNGVDGVPDDGRYHLVVGGELRSSFRSERRAKQAYRETRDRLIEETDFTTGTTPRSRAELLRAEVEALAAVESARESRRRATKARINKGRSRTFG